MHGTMSLKKKRLEFWMQILKLNTVRQFHAEEACYDCSDYYYSVVTVCLHEMFENTV